MGMASLNCFTHFELFSVEYRANIHIAIYFGHMGEGLPFMQQRIDESLPQETIDLENPASTSLQRNVTTP